MRDTTDYPTDEVALMRQLIREIFIFRPLHSSLSLRVSKKIINLLLTSKASES